MRDERWRDDAWHEAAYDRDDLQTETDREAIAARYRPHDPRRDEWEGLDLLVGWGFAVLAIPVVGLLHGIVAAFLPGGDDPAMGIAIGVFAAAYGAPVVTVYGVPVAALAATLLRPLRAEWVHLLVFALLGLLGCWLFEVVMGTMGGSGGDGAWTATTAPYGVAAAVAGRLLAKRCAIARLRRSREMLPADPG